MTSLPDGEDELVQRCLAGESDAVEQLLARFRTEVYSLCVRMLRHHQDAEDVSQEIFLRVVRSLGRWDATRPLRPWVMTIAINRCRTWLTKRSRLPQTSEAVNDVAARADPEPPGELTAALATAVDGLRPDYREVFVLYHEQGHPYEAIAEVVGRPVGTVKTWLHRARIDVMNALREAGLADEETGQGHHRRKS